MQLDSLDLKNMSVANLCWYHNELLCKDQPYYKEHAKHERSRIKNKLISMGQLSNYVLDYEGQL